MVHAKEGELVPVAPLKLDEGVADVKEAAASEAERIPPLENRPLTLFEEILDDAHHRCPGEFTLEHLPNRGPALDGLFGYLVIDGRVGVEGSERFGIAAVERLDPLQDDFLRSHWFLDSARLMPQATTFRFSDRCGRFELELKRRLEAQPVTGHPDNVVRILVLRSVKSFDSRVMGQLLFAKRTYVDGTQREAASGTQIGRQKWYQRATAFTERQIIGLDPVLRDTPFLLFRERLCLDEDEPLGKSDSQLKKKLAVELRLFDIGILIAQPFPSIDGPVHDAANAGYLLLLVVYDLSKCE